MARVDKFTGKPWPREWSEMGNPNGQQCDDCGTECIDRCPRCGAPQCCPRCCTGSATLGGDHDREG